MPVVEKVEKYCPRSLPETTELIKHEMYEAASHFVAVGYLLWRVKNYKHFIDGGYSNVYEYAGDQLSLNKTTVKNLIAVSETFGNRYFNSSSSCSILPTPELKPAYEDFNYSQLTEMLSMSEKQRAQVTPDMSVRQIRELKKGSALVSGSEPDPVSVSAGQTSDQGESLYQTVVLNNIWHELPPDVVRCLCTFARIPYRSGSTYDIGVKLHPKNLG